MKKSSMTALVSSFARTYHAWEDGPKIFDDSMARTLLGEAEYDAIAEHMADGIGYFCPGFSGNRAEALGWVVRHRLAPTPLARAAGEEMRGTYSRNEMERLLAETGFLAYEHPGPSELTDRFFQSYNAAHPDTRMTAEARVNCCLAVRQN